MEFPDYARDWRHRPGWPTPDEVEGLVKDLTSEIREILDGDDWVVLSMSRAGVARAHAAAALWHCCVLLREVERVHARGEELVGRILARTMLESWFVGMYLFYDGIDALEAIAADYKNGLIRQHDAARDIDDRILRRRERALAHNAKVERDNVGIAARNSTSPANQVPLREPMEVPKETTLDIDSTRAIASLPGIKAKALPLRQMVDRVAALTADTPDATSFSMAYDLIYRGLSGLGAHPSLWVLDSYLDDRERRGNFVRIRDASAADSFAQPNLDSGLLLVSTLAARLLQKHGAATPVADGLLERYTLLEGDNEP